MKNNKPKLPRYALLNDLVAVRLIGNEYYRDAGNWYVGARCAHDGKLLTVSPHFQMNGLTITATTKKIWKKDNGRWAEYNNGK